jgi:hypothetical protein
MIPLFLMLNQETVQPIQFTDGLDTISRLGKATCIAEGRPYRNESSSFSAGWPGNLSARQAAVSFSEKFDYTVEIKNGIYIFKKKYSNTDDVPSLSPALTKEVFRRISKFSTGFSSRFRGGESYGKFFTWYFYDFYSSLNKEQLQKIKEGIPFSECSPQQQNAIFNAVWDESSVLYLKSINEISEILDEKNQVSIGRSGPAADNPKHPDWITNAVINVKSDILKGKLFSFNGVMSDSSNENNDKEFTDAVKLKIENTECMTILKLKKLMNSERLNLAPEVEDMQLNISGLKYKTVDDVLRGVAYLYDLRFTKTETGEMALELPIVEIPKNNSQLPVAIRRCIPVSVWRAARLDGLFRPEPPPYNPPPFNVDPTTNDANDRYHREYMQKIEAVRQVKMEMFSRRGGVSFLCFAKILKEVKEKNKLLKKKDFEFYPIRDLSDKSKEYFNYTLFLKLYIDLIFSPTFTVFDHLDESVITVKPDHVDMGPGVEVNTPQFVMGIKYFDKHSNLWRQPVTASGILYKNYALIK